MAVVSKAAGAAVVEAWAGVWTVERRVESLVAARGKELVGKAVVAKEVEAMEG